MVNKILLIVMVAIVIGMALIPTVDAVKAKKDICHNGKTLNISVNSNGHDNHTGDKDRACTQQEIDDQEDKEDKMTPEQKKAQKAADKAQKKADKAAEDGDSNADDLQDEADRLQDVADNTSGSTTSSDDKSKSDHAKLQRYLERPSFGYNYKTFQPFPEAGVTIDGQLYQMVDNLWRMFVGEHPTMYQMDVVVQSEHGIREVTFTPNKTCEGCHNNSERFTALIRDGGTYGDDTYVWKTLGTQSTITADREGDFVTLHIVGQFDNSGIMQIEMYDNNNQRQMIFIHFE